MKQETHNKTTPRAAAAAASSSMCFDLDLKLKKKISILHQLLDLLFNQRTSIAAAPLSTALHRDDANSVISSTSRSELEYKFAYSEPLLLP
jgi:hypothetical protein